MNCQKIERKILLTESDELSERELEKIEKHVSVCQHCAEYREGLRRIVSTTREALPDGNPSAVVMSRIRTAAEERITSKPIGLLSHDFIIRFKQPVIGTIAGVAAIMLVVGGLFMLSLSGRSGRISDLNTILAIVAEDHLNIDDYSSGSETETDLRVLANRLLLMEGLSAEDTYEAEYFIPDTEPEPTVFRSRSSAAPQPRKCV